MKNLNRMPSAEWEAKYPSFARECANSALAPQVAASNWDRRLQVMNTVLQLRMAAVLLEIELSCPNLAAS